MLLALIGAQVESKYKKSRRPPQTPTQRQHNKEHVLLAETIKSKRLVEWQSQKHRFENRTKRSASFIDYFHLNRQTEIFTAHCENTSPTYLPKTTLKG